MNTFPPVYALEDGEKGSWIRIGVKNPTIQPDAVRRVPELGYTELTIFRYKAFRVVAGETIRRFSRLMFDDDGRAYKFSRET